MASDSVMRCYSAPSLSDVCNIRGLGSGLGLRLGLGVELGLGLGSRVR